MSEAATSGVAQSFELTELGMRMLAQRYRREHPEATEREVEDHVRAWLRDRPGAPDGDAVGRVVPFPEG
jgi:hypothetical protein